MAYFRNFAIWQVKEKEALKVSFQMLQFHIINVQMHSHAAHVSELHVQTKNRPTFIVA